MNIISGSKKLYHAIGFSIGLIHKNLFLFGRLVLLITASMASGIILDHLLSYFNDGIRTMSWYVVNIALLVGLLGSVLFVVYLIFHILEKQTHSEIKRGKAEHKIRANEQEYANFVHFEEKPPMLKRLMRAAKNKLLTYQLKDMEPDENEDV